MFDRLDDYAWEEAFRFANENIGSAGALCDVSAFGREDVVEIIAIEDGENDGASWIGVFRLADGRFAFVDAGCDYTGWECQAGGNAVVSTSLEVLIRFGLGEDARDRLRLRV